MDSTWKATKHGHCCRKPWRVSMKLQHGSARDVEKSPMVKPLRFSPGVPAQVILSSRADLQAGTWHRLSGQLFGWRVQVVQVVLRRGAHMVHPKGHGQDKKIEVLRACQGHWFLLISYISCCPDIPDQFLLIY